MSGDITPPPSSGWTTTTGRPGPSHFADEPMLTLPSDDERIRCPECGHAGIFKAVPDGIAYRVTCRCGHEFTIDDGENGGLRAPSAGSGE